jgi:CRISPR-associated Csx10 family RAMP protein
VVPAQTLRGALAAKLKRGGADATTLQEVFGPAGMRTTALVPAPPPSADASSLPRPAPLTLRTCKRHPGFTEDPAPSGDAHGAEDALFASLRHAIDDDPGGLDALRVCSVEGCGNVLTRISGLVRRDSDQLYRSQPHPGKRTQTHVGVDRRRDGAASGVLYAREVVNEKTRIGGTLRPTCYRAQVTGRGDHIEALRPVLEEGEEVRVGTSLSRGLGRCRVEAFREAGDSAPVTDRIQRFNAAWRDARGDGTLEGEPAEGALIALTLQTPALFVDPFLRPNPSPDGTALLQAAREGESAHAEAIARLEWVHEVARPYAFQAWNGLAGFPHATDQGLRAGSVLVYWASAVDDALVAALRHIENAGVGLRRHLGLGCVQICDPIHTLVHAHTHSHESEPA